MAGPGLARYRVEPRLDGEGDLVWRDAPADSLNIGILRPVSERFQPHGGCRFWTAISAAG